MIINLDAEDNSAYNLGKYRNRLTLGKDDISSRKFLRMTDEGNMTADDGTE
ncbi:MAG: hypothetical protein VB120_06360 [Lachnospiraceae bacterium]|nr:hypothetical protein [Lachnospiraceae bacterium]